MSKIRVELGEETKEFDLEDVELPEGMRLAHKDEFVSKSEYDELASSVQERLKRQANNLEDKYSSDEHFQSLLGEKGFQFDDDGLIVPSDDEKARDSRIQQYQRWEKEFAKKNVEPLQEKLETVSQELDSIRIQNRDTQILEAARKFDVKDELLTSIGSGKPPIISAISDNLDWFESGEQKGWFVRDGESYKVTGDGPATVSDLFESLKADEDYQHIFKNTRRKSSGLSGKYNSGGFKDMDWRDVAKLPKNERQAYYAQKKQN